MIAENTALSKQLETDEWVSGTETHWCFIEKLRFGKMFAQKQKDTIGVLRGLIMCKSVAVSV